MPIEQAARFRDALLELRRLRDRLPSDPIDLVIGRLDAADARRADAVELVAAPELLQQASLVAIDESAERVRTGCTELLRGETCSGPVRDEVRMLGALLDLVRWLEPTG